MPCPSSGAQPGTGADAQQPPLVPRCGSWARLTASVRHEFHPEWKGGTPAIVVIGKIACEFPTHPQREEHARLHTAPRRELPVPLTQTVHIPYERRTNMKRVGLWAAIGIGLFITVGLITVNQGYAGEEDQAPACTL